jgi:hypothetical protein
MSDTAGQAPSPEAALSMSAQAEVDATAADEGGNVHLWLLGTAFLTAIVVLILITVTGAWDPFRCASDEDCRGGRACYEGQCQYPEVWQRMQLEGTGAN